jgi:hypothetical protein
MLQNGDTVHTERLGNCTVIAIPDNFNLSVKDAEGRRFNISGLNLPGRITRKEVEHA